MTEQEKAGFYNWLNGKVFPRINRTGACWLWQGGKTTAGYAILRLNGAVVYGHRIVWEAFNNQKLGKWHVRHQCHTRHCLNPEHLVRGTNHQNVMDAVRNGSTARRGLNYRYGKHVCAKLKPADVEYILTHFAPGSPAHGAVSLGKRFGVTKEAVKGVAYGRSWRYITVANPSPHLLRYAETRGLS